MSVEPRVKAYGAFIDGPLEVDEPGGIIVRGYCGGWTQQGPQVFWSPPWLQGYEKIIQPNGCSVKPSMWPTDFSERLSHLIEEHAEDLAYLLMDYSGLPWKFAWTEVGHAVELAIKGPRRVKGPRGPIGDPPLQSVVAALLEGASKGYIQLLVQPHVAAIAAAVVHLALNSGAPDNSISLRLASQPGNAPRCSRLAAEWPLEACRFARAGGRLCGSVKLVISNHPGETAIALAEQVDSEVIRGIREYDTDVAPLPYPERARNSLSKLVKLGAKLIKGGRSLSGGFMEPAVLYYEGYTRRDRLVEEALRAWGPLVLVVEKAEVKEVEKLVGCPPDPLLRFPRGLEE